jgi:hypothetical protein
VYVDRVKRRPQVVEEEQLRSAHASLIRSPARQSTMINRRTLIASGPSPAARMTAMISSTGGGSGG